MQTAERDGAPYVAIVMCLYNERECRARAVHAVVLAACTYDIFRRRRAYETQTRPDGCQSVASPGSVEESTEVARRQASHTVVRSTKVGLRQRAESEHDARWPRRAVRVPRCADARQRGSAIGRRKRPRPSERSACFRRQDRSRSRSLQGK